jgi:hypothetical protein
MRPPLAIKILDKPSQRERDRDREDEKCGEFVRLENIDRVCQSTTRCGAEEE